MGQKLETLDALCVTIAATINGKSATIYKGRQQHYFSTTTYYRYDLNDLHDLGDLGDLGDL